MWNALFRAVTPVGLVIDSVTADRDRVLVAAHPVASIATCPDCGVTSTQVYAAALAQRTRKLRIGTAVVVIPFNHPLRTASDFALIDILSHGRLDFGVGRV